MKKGGKFYVGIPDADNIRKDLLGSSKAIIRSLKRYNNYKHIKEEKLSLMYEFIATIKNIDASLSKISEGLPEEPQLSKKNIKETSNKPKRIEELFEQKLEEIEKRLSALKR